MNVSYNWLKEYTGNEGLTARAAADLLGAHAFEIEEVLETDDDTIIDVDILPNRSSDCLCHRGIARELATITKMNLARDPLAEDLVTEPCEHIVVQNEAPEACDRFTASLIMGIEVKESPEWLQSRLQAIGQRSINNIVDATNYVMFALGQPLHAYDADLFPQVNGKWEFGVRFAKQGETISLLAEGGKDEERLVELAGTELLIVDESSGTPIGLAGVKGGTFAEVGASTRNIIIEAAHFDPTITRKTARRLGIVIDASKRFENNPSPKLPSYAQNDIVKLILDIAGGEYKGTFDQGEAPTEPPAVRVSVARVNSLLGVSLTQSEMIDILTRVGCEVSYSEDIITARGPWERTDLTIEEDFIEEIGRLYGYDHVQSIVPEAVALAEYNARHYYSEVIRRVLLEHGFSEVITSSFRKKDEVKLLNALATDKQYLRSSLRHNLDEVLNKNAGFTDLLGTDDTRVFECGTVFSKGRHTIEEHVSLAVGVRVRPSGYSGKEDALLAEAIQAVGDELGVMIEWTTAKGVAECNFTELLKNLPVPEQYEPVPIAQEIVYQPFSVYPAISRDIAMWTPADTEPDTIEELLQAEAGPLCVRTRLFDRFEKDGRVSYAYRLVFQSTEKTLTDEEVNTHMDKVYSAVQAQGWEVR